MLKHCVIAAIWLACLAPHALAEETPQPDTAQMDAFLQFVKASYDPVEGSAAPEFRFVPSWLHPMGNELLKPRRAMEERCKASAAAFIHVRDEEGGNPKRPWTGYITSTMGVIAYRRMEWVEKMFARRADKSGTGYRAQGPMAKLLFEIVSAQAKGAFGQFECRSGTVPLWFVDLLPDTTGIMHNDALNLSFTTAVRVRVLPHASAPPPIVPTAAVAPLAPAPDPNRVVSSHPVPD